MLVREVRGGSSARAVQARAEVEAGTLVAGLWAGSLVAGPAEVGDGSRRIADPIDLCPGVPANVTDPHFIRSWPECEAKRVAQAVSDDPPLVRVGASSVGIVRRARTCCRVEAQDRPVEQNRLPRRTPRTLASERAAFGGRWRLCAAHTGGWITAGVRRSRTACTPPALTVVGERETRAVAARDIEVAVRSEGEVADRVARVLLAPALEQDLFRRRS